MHAQWVYPNIHIVYNIQYNIDHPQVSELCPGEYPTTTHILITDDAIVQNINDVMLIGESQDNILTSVDTISLQSDMIYTIQVSFSNLDGEFNITSNETFSKQIISCGLSYYLIIKLV